MSGTISVGEDWDKHAGILEDAKGLANEAIWMLAIQRRRIAGDEPEDQQFPWRRWYDFQFSVTVLHRLRRCAQMAAEVPHAKGDIESAIALFDSRLPNLRTMRNVGEHIDEYRLGQGRAKKVDPGEIRVATGGLTNLKWFGGELDIDDALEVARQLFDVIKKVFKRHVAAKPQN